MRKVASLQVELVHIAWALNLHRLATTIVGVFIPLIILNSGGKLWTIGLFYVLYAAIKLCFNYSCMELIRQRGAHFGLGLGFGFSALQMISILGYAHTHSTSMLALAEHQAALAELEQHYHDGDYYDPDDPDHEYDDYMADVAAENDYWQQQTVSIPQGYNDTLRAAGCAYSV